MTNSILAHISTERSINIQRHSILDNVSRHVLHSDDDYTVARFGYLAMWMKDLFKKIAYSVYLWHLICRMGHMQLSTRKYRSMLILVDPLNKDQHPRWVGQRGSTWQHPPIFLVLYYVWVRYSTNNWEFFFALFPKHMQSSSKCWVLCWLCHIIACIAVQASTCIRLCRQPA